MKLYIKPLKYHAADCGGVVPDSQYAVLLAAVLGALKDDEPHRDHPAEKLEDVVGDILSPDGAGGWNSDSPSTSQEQEVTDAEGA